MKTITDVVFCVSMTQYYMDEQIFVEILVVSLEKGTPSSYNERHSSRIGNENSRVRWCLTIGSDAFIFS